MHKKMCRNIIMAISLISIVVAVILPIHAFGEVKQITQTQEKLAGISEEEKAVLKDLFTINQKIDELNAQSDKIQEDIRKINQQMDELQSKIDSMKKDYEEQLGILKNVLVNYQRGGPASYLEILLSADDLSTFLKSLNVIKDISHNVKELLNTLEDSKKALEAEKAKLDEKHKELEQKNLELLENLKDNQQLQKEKEDYLASLQEDKDYYEEQLNNLELMWTNCQELFPKLADGITKAINEGNISIDDLNMKFGILTIDGYLKEETFNQILAKDDRLTDITFDFGEDQVILNVPKEHLVLTGNFTITGDSAISYEVISGTFYDMPLEQSSVEELFQNGPLMIDFESISEGIITVEFTLNKVESKEDKLTFEINPIW